MMHSDLIEPSKHARSIGRRLARILWFAALACAVIQLALGAGFAALVCCVASGAAGLLAFTVLGARNVGAWIALVYSLGSALIPLYSKSLLWQPIDSNLSEPSASFMLVAIGAWLLLFVLLLVRRLPVGAPVFRPIGDPRTFAFLSWGCFALGTLAFLWNRWIADASTGEVFGGLAIFRDILLMAVIARVALLLSQSEGARSFDLMLGCIITCGVVFGLLDNAKTLAALPVVSYFVAVFALRGSVSKRATLLLVVGAISFSALLAPFVHALRALGQQEMTLTERVDFVWNTASKLIGAPERFGELQKLASSQFAGGYYNYFGGGGAGQMLLGRYAAVQQIDPVVAEHVRKGDQGGEAVWPAFARLLPSAFNQDKSADTGLEFSILVQYGLIDPGGGKFPTLPVVGQSLAAFGLPGVFGFSVLAFALMAIVLKKLGWNLGRNLFGIFVVCQFAVVYPAQASFGQYLAYALRFWPTLALVFVLLIWSARLRTGARQPNSIHSSRDQ